MKNKLEQLKKSALAALEKIKTEGELRDFEVKYFGRKGEYNELVKELPKLSAEEKKEIGRLANDVKLAVEEAMGGKQRHLEALKMENIVKDEWIDKTLPGKKPEIGHTHLITQAVAEIAGIFERLGFVRRRYPEVEWDWYAFEALNMPKDHPARDEWETFFIDAPEGNPSSHKATKDRGKMVLTPHTSSGQVREMERGELPIRMMNISKCYRRQSDVTHVPMFHQFEGLLIDKNVSIAQLKGTLDYFAREFFGPGRVSRLRPHHFPFTEPSFEVDFSCGICDGRGNLPDGSKCRMCKQGWLELGGAGMVHPNVLRAGKIFDAKWNGLAPLETADASSLTGFAFGWGVERTFMMKEGMKIDDIRILYKNDLRFIKQF